mmetsp:Transcript_3130/g.11703  ORF Transcript_3130/g.11703 Transcript_3130/m.11703 type:complete len:366 (+) Transcript_3130:774-1871(+)
MIDASLAAPPWRAVHLRRCRRASVLLAVPSVGIRAALSLRRMFVGGGPFVAVAPWVVDGISARHGGLLVSPAAARGAAGELRGHLLAHDDDSLRRLNRLFGRVALGQDVQRRGEELNRRRVHLLGDRLRHGGRRPTALGAGSLDAVGEQVIQRVNDPAHELLDLLEGSLAARLLGGRGYEFKRFPSVGRESPLREGGFGEFVEQLADRGRGDALALLRVGEELLERARGQPPRGAFLPSLSLRSLLVAGRVMHLGRRFRRRSIPHRARRRTVVHAPVLPLHALDVLGSVPAAAAAAAASVIPVPAARSAPGVPEASPAPIAPVIPAAVERRAPIAAVVARSAAAQPIAEVDVAARLPGTHSTSGV